MKIDPIREKYYKPLEAAEKWSDILFYVAAVLSVAALFVEKTAPLKGYDITQTLFVVAVIAVFVIGQFIRLYLLPRAERTRRQDFFSSAYKVSLSHELTSGYYNNDQTVPLMRIGAQLLENSFFSKEIARDMAKTERWKAIAYIVIWLAAVSFRSSDLAFVAVAAQALFSEQIASRWLRIEWLRKRFEETYDELFRLLQSNPDQGKFDAMILDSLVTYETGKATGAITLSSEVFERLGPGLSQQWERIKREIGL